MKIIIPVLVFILLIFALFLHLIQQSKKPSGLLGKFMMNVWNSTYASLYEFAVSIVRIDKDDQILDIGVGNGASSAFLASKIGDGGKVVGIDYSQKAITEAIKKNSKATQDKRIKFLNADICDLPFADNSFTLATAFQTHFHWQDFESGLREIRRVLSSGSRLLIACEYSKIEYYQKEYSDINLLSKVFETNGFALEDSVRRGQWQAYVAVAK